MVKATTEPKEKSKKALGKEFEKRLPQELLDVFHEKYQEFTDVQIRSGTELLSFNDVVVESPTGSGKTLAFLLPTLTIMAGKGKFSKDEYGALILSPSRELATQISTVAAPYAEKLGYTISLCIGGTKIESNVKNLKKKGGNILIATPGRLFQLLTLDKDNSLRRALKSVEVLIVDEADRFNESQFEVHLKEILAAIPKQRRTGLFSATQAKERGDLVIFGLRNPKTIKLKESINAICPDSLNNFYTVCEAAEKLMCTVEFIRSKPGKKILVFFPSCNGVVYFHTVLQRVLTKRSLFAVHGRSSAKERTTQIDEFKKSEDAVMLSTDVMARGIDIDDIDWVIQFEVPKLSSWFVHRAGRTGRSGREGNALLVLTPQQTAYIGFVATHEQVVIKEIKVPTNNAKKAEELREKIVGMACSDREILEAGTKAYVSHIESYVKHDCNVVCGLKEFDVTGLAHAYGLLRLPKMRELTNREDLKKFKRSDVETSTIKYLNPKLEKNRAAMMEKKHEEKVKTLKEKAAEKAEKERRRNKNKKPEDVRKAEKRKLQEDKEDRDDFDNDVKFLKKLKKGRLSSKEIKDVRF